jgi:hypothetical protein
MSDPKRLRHGKGDVTRLLLESALDDIPPAGARARALLSLGASAGTALIVGKAAAASKVGSAAGMSGAATIASFGTKALVVGIVAATVGAGVVTHKRYGDNKAVAAVTPTRKAKPENRNTPSDGTPPALRVSPAGSAAAEPVRSPTSAEARPRALEKSGELIRPDALPEERATLELARSALSAGRASVALKLLSDYEQRYGFGDLGHEETVLRVKALLALGRRTEALETGGNYLKQHPNGTQVSQIERLLSSVDGGSHAE